MEKHNIYLKKYFYHKHNNDKYKMKKYIKKLVGGSKHYKFTVQEPWFTFIRLGQKKVEGRLNIGIFSKLQAGDTIEWINKKNNQSFVVIVNEITKYGSFKEMIEKEGIENVLPGIDTIEKGTAIYRQFYEEAKEKQNGVLAIKMIS